VSLIVDAHREYLSDPARLDAYRRAIHEIVRPGMVVADLGSGTGILGLFALAAGAARVYSIEATGMIEIARALAAANGFGGRFHAVQSHSSEAELPERVDAILSDFVGRFGFDADILEIYPDAVTRLLKPDGQILPSAISLSVAPVERADMHAQVRFWRERRAEFDVTPALEWAMNTGYPVELTPADLLANPVEAIHVQVRERPVSALRASVEFVIRRGGMLHGIGGWSAARLSAGVTLTNSPLARDRIKRKNVFLPLRAPLDVVPGDCVQLTLAIVPDQHIVNWTVSRADAHGAVSRQVHSTLRGMLTSRDDLARAHPDFVPVLTPRGHGRLTVLQLCDGTRTLREIEDEVFARHRDLFTARGDAAAFVAEVVSGYTHVGPPINGGPTSAPIKGAPAYAPEQGDAARAPVEGSTRS
jgi:SAM-dependent methyltransferase